MQHEMGKCKSTILWLKKALMFQAFYYKYNNNLKKKKKKKVSSLLLHGSYPFWEIYENSPLKQWRMLIDQALWKYFIDM